MIGFIKKTAPVSVLLFGFACFSPVFAQNATDGAASKQATELNKKTPLAKKPTYEQCLAKQSADLKAKVEREKKELQEILNGAEANKALGKISALTYDITLNEAGYTAAIIGAVQGKPKPVIRAVAEAIFKARKQLLKNEKEGVCPVGADLILAAVAGADPEFQAIYTDIEKQDPTTSIGDGTGFKNVPRPNNPFGNQGIIGVVTGGETPASPN